LEVVELSFNKDDSEKTKEVLEDLFEICQSSPNFLKKVFPRVMTILSKVRDINDDEYDNLKIEALDCLVSFVITYNDLIQKDDALRMIIDLIFKNMIEIEDDIPTEWMSPPDGFNDDLFDSDD
jgi:hypothetical protein